MTIDGYQDAYDNPPPQAALVYAPGRRRDRVPENCVRIMADDVAANGAANPAQGWFAATVIGPMRSSEGLRVFYVTQWH